MEVKKGYKNPCHTIGFLPFSVPFFLLSSLWLKSMEDNKQTATKNVSMTF